MGIETIAAVAAIAGTVISVAGTAYAIDQGRANANKAKDQAEADAAAAQGQAEVEAAKIRKAAKAQRSAAVAALAASGVDVAAGTAEQIQTDISQRGEEDALTMILGGGRRGRYLQQEGAMAVYGASQRATGSVISGLSSVAGSARGWKSTNTQSAGTDYSQYGAFTTER